MRKKLMEMIKALCCYIVDTELELSDDYYCKYYCWYCGNSHYDEELGSKMNTVEHEKDCIYIQALNILEELKDEQTKEC